MLFLPLLIGVIAGLRALTAPAAVSWAARLEFIHLGHTWLAFLGYMWVPWVFTALAVCELVKDQLSSTPSRTVPVQFAARLVSGAFAGAAIGLPGGSWIGSLVAGFVGAIIGTYGGAGGRAWLSRTFGRDLPAALIEDGVAVGAAFLILIAIP